MLPGHCQVAQGLSIPDVRQRLGQHATIVGATQLGGPALVHFLISFKLMLINVLSEVIAFSRNGTPNTNTQIEVCFREQTAGFNNQVADAGMPVLPLLQARGLPVKLIQ